MSRICRVCNIEFFEKARSNICKPCAAEYAREYRKKNIEMLKEKEKQRNVKRRQDASYVERKRARGRAYWAEIKHEVFMAYGGYRCNCCGEAEPLFLTLDHIHENGAEHRRSLGASIGNGRGGWGRTLKWIRDNGFPDGYQVLCMNCNLGKHKNGGTCPHKNVSYNNRVNSVKAQNG